MRSSPVDVMQARLEIEPALARLSALRDSALHRLIAATAGNPILLTVFDIVDQVRQDEVWHHHRERARSRERTRLYARQHEAIVDAIEARDAPGASESMAQIRTLQEMLLAVTPAEITE